MMCSVCKNNYHLGQSCAGITETSYSGMGQAKRDKWRCKTCRTQDNRSGSQSGACFEVNKSQDLLTSSAVENQMQAFGQKLDQLLSMKTSIDSLLSLPAKEMDNKVDGLAANYTAVLAVTTANETKISELEKQHQELSVTVKDQAETILAMQEQINNSEQYGRLANMEIRAAKNRRGKSEENSK
ncbi:unnamed protein product [Ixodes hexagonus]